MSNREIAKNIIDSFPEYKLTYIIDVLNGLKMLLEDVVEEVEPDELDLAMIAEAERVNDGTTVTLDELLKKDGLTYADLQDWVWKIRSKVSW